MIYCPYTNQDIDETLSNKEHIIPLAVGGVNGFDIRSSIEANSLLGSSIDAVIARDFLMMIKRDRYDVRGHSRKEPMFIAKGSSNPEGLPLEVGLGQRSGLKVWSPREGEYITDQRAGSLNISFKIDIDIALRFVAKVALSAGYFSYGELFRKQVEHSNFRAIMNAKPLSLEGLQDVEARVDDRFDDVSTDNGCIFRALCEDAEPCSIVALLPGLSNFGVFVDLLGDYVGMINVPADTRGFPNANDFRLGHVIELRRPGMIRRSFHETLLNFAGKHGCATEQ